MPSGTGASGVCEAALSLRERGPPGCRLPGNPVVAGPEKAKASYDHLRRVNVFKRHPLGETA